MTVAMPVTHNFTYLLSAMTIFRQSVSRVLPRYMKAATSLADGWRSHTRTVKPTRELKLAIRRRATFPETELSEMMSRISTEDAITFDAGSPILSLCQQSMAEPPSGASTPSVCSPNFAPYEYECSPTGASTPFERSPVFGRSMGPLTPFQCSSAYIACRRMAKPYINSVDCGSLNPRPAVLPLLSLDFDLQCHEMMSSPPGDRWSVDDCLSPAHARAKSMAMPELELPASAVLSFVSVERISVITPR